MIFVADPQPIAQIVPKRQAKLLAGLRKAQHAVARLAAVATDRASGNLPLDDEATQIALGCIGVERDLRPLQNPQQFWLAAPEPKQQLVKLAIPGADGENPVEARLQAHCRSGIRPSSIRFQGLVKVPDQLAQGFGAADRSGARLREMTGRGRFGAWGVI